MPITLKKETGAVNPHLELALYCDRLQLVTKDALYSDGDKYTPALVALRELDGLLPSAKSVLMLGGGLCSLPRIMMKKGSRAKFTIVEIDKVVLGWALEDLAGERDAIVPVCMDAADYMSRTTEKFDLVFIDIFNGMVVPDFVASAGFLTQCRNALSPHGRLAFNYIVNDERKWQELQATLAQVFPGYRVVKNSVNMIVIA